jgi:hypothetical protein
MTTLSLVPFVRGHRILWQARALLLASRAAGAEVEARLSEVEGYLDELEQLALPGLGGWVRLLRAAVAWYRGDLDAAMDAIEVVLGEDGDGPEAMLLRAAAERRKGELLRGEKGLLTVARSDARLREQGVHEPRSFVRLLVPELDSAR